MNSNDMYEVEWVGCGNRFGHRRWEGGRGKEHSQVSLFLKFIYFWLLGVFVAACRLSLVASSGGYSSLWCAGFSLWWLLLLWSTGSRHVGFSSCGTRAQ